MNNNMLSATVLMRAKTPIIIMGEGKGGVLDVGVALEFACSRQHPTVKPGSHRKVHRLKCRETTQNASIYVVSDRSQLIFYQNQLIVARTG